MNAHDSSHLIATLWRFDFFIDTTLTNKLDGKVMRVLKSGEPSDNPLMYYNASIEIDGQIFNGSVLLGSEATAEDSAILRLVESDIPHLFDINSNPIRQAIASIPAHIVKRYEELIQSDIKSCPCGEIVAQMDSVFRTELFTRLVISRLQRKCELVEKIHTEGVAYWGQTMYSMLFRAMGDHKNQNAFLRLSEIVPYPIISRERGNGNNVEIILIGASGLLQRYFGSSHTRQIQRDFEYLARKHSIVPMKGGEWNLTGINPNNHPFLRISQLASFVSHTDFIFDQLIKCRTADDIQALLGNGEGHVSEYWESHFTPDKRSTKRPKKIGKSKINLLGINFAVPVIFAYGRYMRNEELQEQALDMLESLEAESNYITRHWCSKGIELRSSFDSQAVIELENDFCAKHDCWRCPIGRREIKKVLK